MGAEVCQMQACGMRQAQGRSFAWWSLDRLLLRPRDRGSAVRTALPAESSREVGPSRSHHLDRTSSGVEQMRADRSEQAASPVGHENTDSRRSSGSRSNYRGSSPGAVPGSTHQPRSVGTSGMYPRIGGAERRPSPR